MTIDALIEKWEKERDWHSRRADSFLKCGAFATARNLESAANNMHLFISDLRSLKASRKKVNKKKGKR